MAPCVICLGQALKNIPRDLESHVFRKLQILDDASTDQDLRVPLSNHFEKLRGDLAGFTQFA